MRTLDALQETLNELHREYSAAAEPVLAEIEAPTGDSLAIGLGREWSVLNFVPASREPPYSTSVGRRATAAVGDVAVFRFGDEWTEIPSYHLIPIAVARDAVRVFFETAGRPDSVEWEED